MWVMNEDGTRDVEEEDEDELASPPTLLRRILQRDTHSLTAGFEVSSREGGVWNGKGGHTGSHVYMCDLDAPAMFRQDPFQPNLCQPTYMSFSCFARGLPCA